MSVLDETYLAELPWPQRSIVNNICIDNHNQELLLVQRSAALRPMVIVYSGEPITLGRLFCRAGFAYTSQAFCMVLR
jgi:hypothetical protein